MVDGNHWNVVLTKLQGGVLSRYLRQLNVNLHTKRQTFSYIQPRYMHLFLTLQMYNVSEMFMIVDHLPEPSQGTWTQEIASSL